MHILGVVTYDLEAEYTDMRGTVSIADKLLTLITQHAGRREARPRAFMDGMTRRIMSCIAVMFTCWAISTLDYKIKGVQAYTDETIDVSRRML